MIARAEGLRTIWLMGAKTRLIPGFIEGAVADLLPEGGTFVDLCSGTGVVGRALAHRYRVIANDVLAFASVISRAHLVGDDAWARVIDELDPEADLDERFRANYAALARLAPSAIEGEATLLPRVIDELGGGAAPAGDDDDAAARYRELLEATPAPHGADVARLLEERRLDPARAPFCLVTLCYQNVYFGIRQAMAIDSYRAAIQGLPADDPHVEGKRALYLAALLYAASFSTSGTSHFAQPRSVHKDRELRAVAKRRVIDIEAQFALALDGIRREWLDRAAVAPPPASGHRVYQLEAETLLAPGGVLDGEEPGLVYLDPPYTADHYSRFYHVLETLVSYDYPELEQRRGQLTRGRYPVRMHRYQSPFCRPAGVEEAFRRVAAHAHARGANLIVSYSADSGLLLKRWRAAGETNPVGRFRSLFREHYPNVEVRRRQLLHSGQGDSNRSVEELLVLCER